MIYKILTCIPNYENKTVDLVFPERYNLEVQLSINEAKAIGHAAMELEKNLINKVNNV